MNKIMPTVLFALTTIAFAHCGGADNGSGTNQPPTDSATITSPDSATPAAATAHTSNNSLDWDGIYRGILPCADCPGIKTTIYLNRDLTYVRKSKYMDRPAPEQEEKGKFTWDADGQTITLDASGQPAKYAVGENTLTQLDMSGAKITGNLAPNYVLSKANYAILGRRWKLVELNGKPIAMDSSHVKEAFITFDDKEDRVSGNTSCNNFSGRFETGPLNKIHFSKMISTRMACRNMEIERDFLKMLETADNFTINADELVLNKARMAPIARFKSAFN
ncbi:copper resistance protein NlpE N-terminal domain-containing protein [Paraflavitalea pollutisoli]|uniref:copper resistance protein NlpE N-terminal domain-containing protein n=1 Tax=Paraflavitalea pollutisoli TaxID=3034143 RepID=UPI0023EAEC35|nr:copper resistance protein NlpE N-terminal domain-containing protein [Paraflavitalea sp. H1-2-19X]